MTPRTNRQYYIDWLRILIFGMLFVYHVCRIFSGLEWHVDNAESSWMAAAFIDFTHSWRMPLVFLISGAGTFFAMKARKDAFFKDRILRLVVPFIFGVLILVPPQQYLDTVAHGRFSGSLSEFLLQYPQMLRHVMVWTSPAMFMYIGYHLWYLAYLFVITICLVPLLILINKDKRVSTLIQRSAGMPFLLMTLVIFVGFDFVIRPVFQSPLGWADFSVYTYFFFFGFIMQLSDEFIRHIQRLTWPLLGVAIGAWTTMRLQHEWIEQVLIAPAHTFRFLEYIVLKDVNTFAWIMALLGLSRKFLEFNSKRLNDFTQGILPFYIIHQPVIVVLAYYVVRQPLPMFVKFAVIFILSLFITIGLYQLARRSKFAMFCLGMSKVQPKSATPGSTAVSPAKS